jgi:uncharacterized protein with NAD-binding domain and iron-sulfur cluster
LSRRRVLIIGAGLAGLIAAYTLARRGMTVTVLEASSIPGGKIASWKDQEGDPVEHGVHFWPDQYHNLNRILAEIGIDDAFCEPTPGFDLLYTDGTRCTVRPQQLGSPLGLIRLLWALPGLSLADRLTAFWACLRLGTISWRRRHELDQVSAWEWATQAGMSVPFIRQFFEPVVGGVLFTPLRELSMAAALCGRHALNPRTCRVRWLRGPIYDCVTQPLMDAVTNSGGRILLNHRALELIEEGGRIAGVLAGLSDGSQTQFRGDWTVLATNVTAARSLMSGSWSNERTFRKLNCLHEHPVITGRFWFGRSVNLGSVTNGHVVGHALDAFLMVVVVSAVQTGGSSSELVIEVQMGPAEPYMHWSDEALSDLVLDQLSAALPEIRGLAPRKAVWSRFKDGFTAFSVGSDSCRPGVETPVPNLFFAGDWVRSDQPVLAMERAALTGIQAANAVLAACQEPVEIIFGEKQHPPHRQMEQPRHDCVAASDDGRP